MGIAAGTAIFISRLLKLEHAFWVVLGILPILGVRAASPLRTFWSEQAGTLIGFLFGVALVAVLGEHQAWYWLVLPCVIFTSAYASSALNLTLGQAGFTLFVIVLFCILSPAQRQVGRLRVEDIAIGGAVSLLVSSLQHFMEAFSWRNQTGLQQNIYIGSTKFRGVHHQSNSTLPPEVP